MKGALQTKEDFEEIKQQIKIEAVADLLMQRQGRMYIYPGERTGSIRIYPATQSFFDFGRSCGGDAIRLWAHVQGVDSWTALREIKATFGLNATDRKHSRDAIKAAEQARKRQLEAKKQKQEEWIQEVDRLKKEVELLSGILNSGQCEPLSWAWCLCKNRLTLANGMLDLLCEV